MQKKVNLSDQADRLQKRDQSCKAKLNYGESKYFDRNFDIKKAYENQIEDNQSPFLTRN